MARSDKKTINLPADLHADLKLLAQIDGVYLQDMVEAALRRLLAGREAEVQRIREAFERVKAAG